MDLSANANAKQQYGSGAQDQFGSGDALYSNILSMPPPLRNRVTQKQAFAQGKTEPIDIPRRGQLNGQG